ncbi:MAG TPA: plastocyanin/azurin family copper-binding protein [Methanobacterium sp.]|nr:plastocyanin/azurin family copper-binding protein [Methanobacterium sp.]
MKKQLLVLLLALAVAIGFSGATVAADPGYSKQVSYPKKTVTIYNFAFHPPTLIVKKGTTVTWINRQNVDHTVTSTNGKFPSSGHIKPGSSYKVTFTKTGTYRYHCSIHDFMKGTIIIKR